MLYVNGCSSIKAKCAPLIYFSYCPDLSTPLSLSIEILLGIYVKMRFLALSLLAASAIVLADTENEGHHGGGNLWVRDFKNLVAFGDR